MTNTREGCTAVAKTAHDVFDGYDSYQLPVRTTTPDHPPPIISGHTVNIMRYLEGMEEGVRKDLAKYLCTGTVCLNINESNLETYIYVANSLQLFPLKKQCENICLNLLHPANCLAYFVLSETYECIQLFQSAFNMVIENFGTLWKTEDFQCLGRGQIMTLLRSPDVNLHPDVGDALEYWFLYEIDFRRRSYNDMMAWLENKINNNTIRTGPESLLNSSIGHQCSLKVDHVALFGFEDGEKKPTGISINTHKFNICQRKCKIQQHLGSGFATCSMTIDDAPYIIVSGGENQASRQTLRYDVILNKWKSCKKMRVGRSRHVMAAIGERLYVLGGFHDGRQLSSVEEFNPYKKSWEIARSDLICPVRSGACAVFNEKIYVFGGKINDNTSVATIQCFDPKTNTVRMLNEPLPHTCTCGKAVTFGRYIYVTSTQGHVIRFDPVTETSKVCRDQPFKRRNFGMFCDSKKIYLAGGCGKKGDLSCVHAYDPAVDIWSHAGELPMAVPVYGACAVNYGPFQDFRKCLHSCGKQL